jgi:hypothetical protein
MKIKRFRSLIFEGLAYLVVNPNGLSLNYAWWLYYDKISQKNLDLAKSDQLFFTSNHPIDTIPQWFPKGFKFGLLSEIKKIES